MHTGTPSMDTLPQELTVVQKFNHLKAAFPSETSSLSVVVKAKDVTAPAVTGAIAKLEQATHQHKAQFPGEGPFDQDVSPDKTVTTLSMEAAGDGSDDLSAEALDTLRDDLVPATLGTVGGLEAYSTGDTAADRDFNDSMISHLPLVFGFVILAAFLLLLFTFRSIVVPIKAILLNLLSVGAAYGAMVLVFQHGWFNGLLGIPATGPIESWIPLFMFVVLFGLSMDYHVFILTRVRELVRPRHEDRGRRLNGDQEHRRRRDQRRRGHGLRVRDLRDALVDDVQADGPGPVLRHPARRHADPRSPAPGEHEAARRAQLVAAEEARLAAHDPPRGRGGAREGVAQRDTLGAFRRPPHGGRRSSLWRAAGSCGLSGLGPGIDPDEPDAPFEQPWHMSHFLLHHSHRPPECAATFAAWRGFSSPLRHRPAPSTCLAGGHALWWRVVAADRAAALALLPPYVAERTIATQVREVTIP